MYDSTFSTLELNQRRAEIDMSQVQEEGMMQMYCKVARRQLRDALGKRDDLHGLVGSPRGLPTGCPRGSIRACTFPRTLLLPLK